MTFPNSKSPKQIDDVVAYLKQFDGCDGKENRGGGARAPRDNGIGLGIRAFAS